MNSRRPTAFQRLVIDFYKTRGRHDMPWRQRTEPYHILVSELMLQQTQVSRVLPKFNRFMKAFPTIESLARAPLSDVLGVWLGLGYNRRAQFLQLTARAIVERFGGELPTDQPSLESLPGIGPNTAGAIMAYAFNQPAIFVETNIRTVYIHHFLQEYSEVNDAKIRQLLEATLLRGNPREWYWALMDYGTHLKATAGNNIHRSRHYTRQSRFQGSLRQLRGAVLRQLHEGPISLKLLNLKLADERLPQALRALEQEGFIEQAGGVFCLTGSAKLP